MKWLLLAVLVPPLFLGAVLLALRVWLRRQASRAERENLWEEFDGGLAIPMRDSDTRRNSQKPS